MQPINAQKSQFIERWSKAEYLNGRLTVITVALACVCLILSGAFVYTVVKPSAIYYIPGVVEAGIAKPQAMPYATVGSFVSSWVLNWSNFTPANVQDVYTRAGRFMSPYLAGQTQARLARDVDEVKHNNISSLFSITDDPKVLKEKTGFMVTLEGDKGIYMGKDEIKNQHMVYRVRVRQINPTENNPYGLMIEDIDQEVK